ncbi:hypothetical protein, partial [Burkholderia metallica]|uniref:hypothetical protein n=1 Tax=Burkholderia metallica TaxID=488729 RepID=UPI001A8FB485
MTQKKYTNECITRPAILHTSRRNCVLATQIDRASRVDQEPIRQRTSPAHKPVDTQRKSLQQD